MTPTERAYKHGRLNALQGHAAMYDRPPYRAEELQEAFRAGYRAWFIERADREPKP